MAIATEGSFSQTLDYAETTIANSAEFRSLVAAATVAAAKNSIFWGRTDESDATQNRPRCLLRFPDELDVQQLGTTGFNTRGAILAILEFDIPTANVADFQDRYKWVINKIGLILDQLKTVVAARTGGILNVTNFELVRIGPSNPKTENGDNFAIGVFLLHYTGE